MTTTPTDVDKHSELSRIDAAPAKFRPAEDIATSCGRCMYYTPGDYGSANGSCQLVGGVTIRPDFTCNLFAATAVPEDFSLSAEITKIDEEQQVVFGWAKLSIRKGEQAPYFDLQKDAVTPEELEKMAYDFVLESREGDEIHEGPAIAKMVESMMFTEEKLEKFATGPDGEVDSDTLATLRKTFPIGWWVGFHVEDADVWKSVKDGTYTMFSIAGKAVREAAEDAA